MEQRVGAAEDVYDASTKRHEEHTRSEIGWECCGCAESHNGSERGEVRKYRVGERVVVKKGVCASCAHTPSKTQMQRRMECGQ